MDTQRLILIAAFSMVSLMLWQSWDLLNNPDKYVEQQQTSLQTSPQIQQQDGSVPTTANIAGEMPNLPADSTVSPQAIQANKDQALNSLSKRVHVTTDLLDIEIDTQGADIKKVLLLDYPIDVNHNKNPVVLMDQNPERYFISQTGILNKDNIKQYAPDHHTIYETDQYEYKMVDKQPLKVSFSWVSDDKQMEITKTYIFTPGHYNIEVVQDIKNLSNKTISGYAYRQLQRNDQASKSMLIHTYTGGMLYRDGGGFEKYSFSDMQDEALARNMKGGWLSIIEHYFLASWIPNAEQTEHYYSRVFDAGNYQQRYILGMTSSVFNIAPNQIHQINDQLFIGPKLQDDLKQISANLEDTVDYGFLAIIGHPISWLLNKIYSFVGNWGWSIILLTLCIKLVFFKLSAYSYRSMAEMRKLGPKLKALQEQHKNNPQEKNKAMMDMYKKEKINPLGGCLPVVVQIPVFIALYWVLLESVELRQADFMWWLNNLSVADPYFVLPLVMGVTMFIQQKLNPAPTDPIQAKVMMMLPVIFTVFFAFFPSGLVLYWVTNNILSIAQQWYITRQIDNA